MWLRPLRSQFHNAPATCRLSSKKSHGILISGYAIHTASAGAPEKRTQRQGPLHFWRAILGVGLFGGIA